MEMSLPAPQGHKASAARHMRRAVSPVSRRSSAGRGVKRGRRARARANAWEQPLVGQYPSDGKQTKEGEDETLERCE